MDGVIVKKLRVIPDERGWLMEILRNDDSGYTEFGQVYVTAVYDGAIKAWHRHARQTDHVACIVGMIKLVLVDKRDPLFTLQREYYIGELNPCIVTIPPEVYHGWKAYDGTAVVVNIPDRVYDYDDPDEHRVDPHSLGYCWDRVDR